MTTDGLINWLRQAAQKLCNANGANVTVMFALTLIPMVGAVGAAVDYSLANSVKVAMQAAADSTALMVSKEAGSLTNSQIQTKANNYFLALFTRPEATGVTVTATYTTDDGSKVVIDASSNLKTNFMGLMGISTMLVRVGSEVKWGNIKLRVALALDNTGSMSGSGKMQALQSAAKAFISQMQSTAAANGDVYVSIIPFANDVNVGKGNWNVWWISWDKKGYFDGWDAENGKCSILPSLWKTEDSCKKVTGVWTPNNHNTWNGCVTDRNKQYDTTNDAPDINSKNTLFPADQESNCPVELMPLSYDWLALKNKIDSMSPKGNTNQAIGLQWAFQSLTGAPLTVPPLDPKFKTKKIIILLTDGLNTQNRYTKTEPGFDTSSKRTQEVDQRTKEACKNIKNSGITLYTVQVNTDGDPTSSMLKDCASTPDKFFLLKSSSAIVATFNQIGTEISMRRIAQ